MSDIAYNFILLIFSQRFKFLIKLSKPSFVVTKIERKYVSQWRSQKLALGGANLHFYLKISLYIVLMYEKFKNSIISSA
jgi:hypothetical protein